MTTQQDADLIREANETAYSLDLYGYTAAATTMRRVAARLSELTQPAPPEQAGAKDAARYRWLRSDDIEVLPNQPQIWVASQVKAGPQITLTESELDAAIDAAMGEPK